MRLKLSRLLTLLMIVAIFVEIYLTRRETCFSQPALGLHNNYILLRNITRGATQKAIIRTADFITDAVDIADKFSKMFDI